MFCSSTFVGKMCYLKNTIRLLNTKIISKILRHLPTHSAPSFCWYGWTQQQQNQKAFLLRRHHHLYYRCQLLPFSHHNIFIFIVFFCGFGYLCFSFLTGLPLDTYSIWWPYSYPLNQSLCILQGLLSETSTNATVLTITSFTIERYIAICHPFRLVVG